MKKISFLLLVMMVTASAAFAQTEKNVQLKQTGVNLIDLAQKKGFSVHLRPDLQNLRSRPGRAIAIKQVGDRNKAVVNLQGTDSFAYILQNGNDLKAWLTIGGTGNSAIIKQKGSNLTTHVKLIGTNNNFRLLQAGQGLANTIKLLHVKGMDVTFLQTKSGFYYAQNGGNGIAFKIQSTQSNPTFIIRNGGGGFVLN